MADRSSACFRRHRARTAATRNADKSFPAPGAPLSFPRSDDASTPTDGLQPRFRVRGRAGAPATSPPDPRGDTKSSCPPAIPLRRLPWKNSPMPHLLARRLTLWSHWNEGDRMDIGGGRGGEEVRIRRQGSMPGRAYEIPIAFHGERSPCHICRLFKGGRSMTLSSLRQHARVESPNEYMGCISAGKLVTPCARTGILSSMPRKRHEKRSNLRPRAKRQCCLTS